MTAVVEIHGLEVRYGKHVAVQDATASFPVGAVGLLGRNGAGKTSILRALLGLVRPAAGRLAVLGRSPAADAAAVRREVGYMPEKDCHVPGLNGYETVELAARLTGLPPRDAARRAHEVLYWVGLDEQRYRPVASYSTGMRQKVKLATALVHDPRVLFLDEPTNGLDPDGRREMLRLIETLAGELQKSVLLSSHILPDVERVCRDVVVMESGRVVRAGTVEELTRGLERSIDLEFYGAREAVLAALDQHPGLRPEPGEGAASRCLVRVGDGAEVRDVFVALRRAEAHVVRLVEKRPTLEDVFFRAIEDRPADPTAEVAS